MALPIINTQPQNQKVAIGGTLSLSVDATSLNTLHYQWLYQDATNIGTDSSVYTKANFQTVDRGLYGVAVGDPTDGTTISEDATVTINPSVTTQPISQAVVLGATAYMDVTAAGFDPITYQWNKVSTPITDATFYYYSTDSFADASRGAYNVSITSDGNTVKSDDATLTRQTTIAIQPLSQSTKFGSPVQVDVTAAGFGSFGYQWRHDGLPIDVSGTSQAYNIDSFQDSSRGVYTVDVTGDGNYVTSSGATLLSAPDITVHPVSQAIQFGSAVSMDVTATGHSPITYQWRKDSTIIGGATNQAYAVASFAEANWGIYDVNVICDGNTTNSDDATLLSVPKILTNPLTQAVEFYDSVTLTVSATGHGLTYQWKKGGSPITGKTASSYTLGNFIDSSRGTYTVDVTADSSTTTSTGAVLTVEPTITVQPVSQKVDLGGSVEVSVTAIGHSPITYQWKQDGGAIGDATFSSYSMTGFDDTNTGSYTVVVTSDGNSVTSSAALLTLQTMEIDSVGSAFPNDFFTIYGDSFGDSDGTVQFMIDGTWTSTASISSWSPEIITCTAPSKNGLYDLKITSEDTTSVIAYQSLHVGSAKTDQGSGGTDYRGPGGSFKTSFSWILDGKTLLPVGFRQDFTSV
jgi:hypothetical protein